MKWHEQRELLFDTVRLMEFVQLFSVDLLPLHVQNEIFSYKVQPHRLLLEEKTIFKYVKPIQ